MKSIKAFATHDSMYDNTRLANKPFGELSTESRTYEKDIAVYPHSTDKSINLVLFSALEDNTKVAATDVQINLTLRVVKSVYDYVFKAAKEIYRDELLNHLLTSFRDVTQSYNVGDIVTDNRYYCPQWVSFKDLDNNEFIVWFSDESFRSEYDQFDLEVVLPTENIDIFFASKSEIEAELEKNTVEMLTRRANSRMGDTPVTTFRMELFNWHNPRNNTPEIKSYWYILVWGDAGDNLDAIKEKIQATILAKSSHNRDDWKVIFPEIFKRNEFTIVPQWNKYSNENKVKEKASLYSPIMDYNTAIDNYAKPYMVNYPETHIAENTQFIALYYRSVPGLICGSNENKDNIFKINQLFGDYIASSSTSTDFNYQSLKTQEWSIRIAEMLTIAETMTETSMLPRERVTLASGEVINGDKIYSKVIRDGKLFLSYVMDGFHYLVAAKKNMVTSG